MTHSGSFKRGHVPWNKGKRKAEIKSYRCVTIDGKQIREHRYVMEQKIGRKLKPGEVVHHINGNIADN